jgi:hypothetical protein
LAGVVFRFVQLPFSCIWLDEAFSIQLARESMLQIVQTLSSDNGSPLFYFLLHGWMRLFGDGEYVLTTLTVLLDCAALIAIPFFLRELFADSRIRIAGTACAAFCLPCLHQATNLRYYSLMVLCTILGWLFFYRALHKGGLRDGLLFVFFSVAGFYTHTLYLFVSLSQFVVLAVFHRDRLRGGFMSSLFLLAGMLLWLPSLAQQISGYLAGSTPETVPGLMRYHGALGAYLLSISSQMLALDGLKAIRMAVAASLILFVLFDLVRGKSVEDRPARELFVAHLFSIGVIVIVSKFQAVFWLDKIDLIGLPMVCALTGYAVSKVRGAPVVLALLIAVNLAGASRYTAWRACGRLTEQRDIIARLAPELSTDDAVIETGISHFTVNYYLDQMRIQTGPRYVYPDRQRTRPSCIDPQELLDDEAELSQEAAALVDALKDGTGRIAVFHSSYEGLAPLYRQLDATFVLEKTLPVRPHPWGPVYTQVDLYRRR